MTVAVGIDSIALYTPRYSFELSELAKQRGFDANHFSDSLGQITLSMTPPGEDIVTMAANAAKAALKEVDVKQIEWVIFATESGIDYSKAAGLYLHELLKLPERCRVIEVKQACYGATGALQLAIPYLRANPDKKILLVASDIARYQLESPGESSQGAGAVALVLSALPRILAFESESGFVSQNVMDFWRPNYSKEAFVDGKYSSKLYLNLLEKAWSDYHSRSGLTLQDHDYFCYHTPLPRLVEKAHAFLAKRNGVDISADVSTSEGIAASLSYARQIGNTYSAALFISFASLIDNLDRDLAGARIGFYSYGSGAVAEFFSGVIQEGYRSILHTNYHTDLMMSRSSLSYEEYLNFYQYHYPEDGSAFMVPFYETGSFRLTEYRDHKRIYGKVPIHLISEVSQEYVEMDYSKAQNQS